MAESLEIQAAELGLRIAEQIVAAALELQPERVLDMARGALRRLVERDRVTIIVNPADLELLSGAIDQLRSELGGIDHIAVHAERRIDRGGAIVRTDLGEIDVTVTAQLERAREIVAAVIRTEEEATSEDSDEPIVAGAFEEPIVVEASAEPIADVGGEPIVVDASEEPVVVDTSEEPIVVDLSDDPVDLYEDPIDASEDPVDVSDGSDDDDEDYVIGEVVDE
jgi:hypothetical protein